MSQAQTAVASERVTRAVMLYVLTAALAAWYALPPPRVGFLSRLAITVLSVTVEAMPFLLIGSVVSAVIHIYVSEEAIARIIPRNAIAGVLSASVLGIVLPVCDCGTVPIVRRLVAKGVPLHVAITFMLAVPMINPLVIFSTWFAFYQFPRYILYRLGFGLGSAIAVGLLMSLLDGKRQLRVMRRIEAGGADEEPHDQHSHHHDEPGGRFVDRLAAVMDHASGDFYDMGRYFIAGVVLSSVVRVVLPQDSLYAIGHNPILSILVTVAAAYVLSVCSQADAFIARTFMGQFSPGAIVAFLIFGPMIDLKNTLMLSSAFRKRFILLLVVAIAAASILSGYLLNLRPGA